MMTSDRKLFTPVQIGPLTLKHRVVMAPLTRSRSRMPGNVPSDLMLEYYTQRASDDGLIITEATNISEAGCGWFGAPSLYSDEQVAGWRKITTAVHAKGGHIFSQLWHTGRSSHIGVTVGTEPVSTSVDPTYWQDKSHLVLTPGGSVQPSPHRAVMIEEVHAVVEDYRRAAERARLAGLDGVELHAANGYLPDQFPQTAAIGGPMPMRLDRELRALSSRRCASHGLRLGR